MSARDRSASRHRSPTPACDQTGSCDADSEPDGRVGSLKRSRHEREHPRETARRSSTPTRQPSQDVRQRTRDVPDRVGRRVPSPVHIPGAQGPLRTYQSIAGTQDSHPPRRRLPLIHARVRRVGGPGRTVRSAPWTGSVNPLRSGYDIQLVGEVPLCGTVTHAGRDLFGCPALGCTVVRSSEENVVGHHILTHCYCAVVYWCDGARCDATFLSRTAADAHREAHHRRENLSREVGKGRLIQMEGEQDVTLWTTSASSTQSASKIRELQARATLTAEGEMEERFARLLRSQGHPVPDHRVYPRPPEDIGEVRDAGNGSPPRSPARTVAPPTGRATTRRPDAPPAAAATGPTEPPRDELPPQLTREVPLQDTEAIAGPSRDLTAPQLTGLAAESAEIDLPQSGPPALVDLILVDPGELADLLGADADGDGGLVLSLDATLDSAEGPAETALPTPAGTPLNEANPEGEGETPMDTLGVGQARVEALGEVNQDPLETTRDPMETTGTTTTEPPACSETLSQFSETLGAQGHLELFTEAAELGLEDRAPALVALRRYGYPDQLRTIAASGTSYNDVRTASAEPHWDPRTQTDRVLHDFARMVPVSHQVHPHGPRYWVDRSSALLYEDEVDAFRLPLVDFVRHGLDMMEDTDLWRHPADGLQPLAVVQRTLRDTLHLLAVALREIDAGLARASVLAAEEAEGSRLDELLQLRSARQRAEGERDLARAALRSRKTPK